MISNKLHREKLYLFIDFFLIQEPNLEKNENGFKNYYLML